MRRKELIAQEESADTKGCMRSVSIVWRQSQRAGDRVGTRSQ